MTSETVFRGGAKWVTVLAADHTLTLDDTKRFRIVRVADGGGFAVKLPPTTELNTGGPVHYITHETGAAGTLDIENSAGTTQLSSLAAGDIAICVWTGTAWAIETSTMDTGRDPNTRVSAVTAPTTVSNPVIDCDKPGSDCIRQCPNSWTQAEWEDLPTTIQFTTSADEVKDIMVALCTAADGNDAAWDGFFMKEEDYSVASGDPYRVYKLTPIPTGKTGLHLNNKKLDETNTGIYWIPPLQRTDRTGCWRREFWCEGAGRVWVDYSVDACLEEYGGGDEDPDAACLPDDCPCDSGCAGSEDPTGFYVQTRWCESPNDLTGYAIHLPEAPQFYPVFSMNSSGDEFCQYVDMSTLQSGQPGGTTLLTPPAAEIYDDCDDCEMNPSCCPCSAADWLLLVNGGVPGDVECALLSTGYRLKPNTLIPKNCTLPSDCNQPWAPRDPSSDPFIIWNTSLSAVKAQPCNWIYHGNRPITWADSTHASLAQPTEDGVKKRAPNAWPGTSGEINGVGYGNGAIELGFYQVRLSKQTVTYDPDPAYCTWRLELFGFSELPHAIEPLGEAVKAHGKTPFGTYVKRFWQAVNDYYHCDGSSGDCSNVDYGLSI